MDNEVYDREPVVPLKRAKKSSSSSSGGKKRTKYPSTGRDSNVQQGQFHAHTGTFGNIRLVNSTR